MGTQIGSKSIINLYRICSRWRTEQWRKFSQNMGNEYKNETIKELCNLMKIEHVTTTLYRHQTIGTVKINHRSFNEYIRFYISADKLDYWNEWLNTFTNCFNTTPSTKHTKTTLSNSYSVNIPTNFDYL